MKSLVIAFVVLLSAATVAEAQPVVVYPYQPPVVVVRPIRPFWPVNPYPYQPPVVVPYYPYQPPVVVNPPVVVPYYPYQPYFPGRWYYR